MLQDAIKEKNIISKWKKFESFFENLMSQQPGFTFVHKHPRSDLGEIDYSYRTNLKDHPIWEYSYLWIECKNWKDPISSEKMSHFINLVKQKNVIRCCGIYITTGRFSNAALNALKNARIAEKIMIIPINGHDLRKIVDKGFQVFLEERCDEIIVRA